MKGTHFMPLDAYDQVFIAQAKGLGWALTRVPGDIWLVRKPNEELELIFVKTKGDEEYLRPKEVKDLTKLDSPVFIAVDGHPDNLVALEDFPQSRSDRGRLPSKRALAANTMKIYKVKLTSLERRLKILDETPEVTEETKEHLRGQIKSLREAIVLTETVLGEQEQERAKLIIDEGRKKLDAILQRREEQSDDLLDQFTNAVDKETNKETK